MALFYFYVLREFFPVLYCFWGDLEVVNAYGSTEFNVMLSMMMNRMPMSRAYTCCSLQTTFGFGREGGVQTEEGDS